MTLPDVSRDEYTNAPIDDRIRPYTVGLTRQNETISTILVYKKGEFIGPAAESVDYYNNFESSVNSLSNPTQSATRGSGVLSVGTVEQPVGRIIEDSLDGKNTYYGIFNNFSLLNIQESHEQIVKLHVNFGADWNAFFFGEQPRVYQFSGFFLDSKDYPYYQEFMVAYDKYLSGRKAIENQVQTKFIYDGKIVDGYMLNISTSQTAADQLIKTFQFTVLVKGFYWIRSNLVPRVKGNVSTTNSSTRLIMKEEFNALNNTNRLAKEQLDGIFEPSIHEVSQVPKR